MRLVPSRHAQGTVGYITGGTARYLPFFDALETTRVPVGSQLARADSCNPARNCNELIGAMRAEDQWIWINGDDHAWQPDLLERLLDRNVDAIVPLCMRRRPPYLPVIYKTWSPQGPAETYTLQELDTLDAAGREVIDVAAAGSAGLLIRRHVLDALREAYGEPVFRVGAIAKDELSEDTELTWKIAQLGFDMCCDLTAFMGHMNTGVVEPYRMADGRLAVTVSIEGGRHMAYAAAPRPAPAPAAEAAE